MMTILVTTTAGMSYEMEMGLDTKLADCVEMPEGIASVELISVDRG